MAFRKLVPPLNAEDPLEVDRFFKTVCNVINAMFITQQSASTATTVSEVVIDLNALITELNSNIGE